MYVSDYSNTSDYILIKISFSAGSLCQRFRTATISSTDDQAIVAGYEELKYLLKVIFLNSSDLN